MTTNAPARTPAPVDQAPAQVSPRAAINSEIARYSQVIRKLLADTGVSEETFTAQIGNALRVTPALINCVPETVMGAALRCAQLNLAPNDGNNLAFIIPYDGKASFQLGYGGIIELARRAAPGIEFEGRPVYVNDLFDIDYGTGRFRHVPWYSRRGKAAMARGGDGEPRLWYVRVVYPNGRQHVHVLDRDQVEYHRSFSKQKDGLMWKSSYDAAALKSVVKDMARWLPKSRTLAQGIAADGQVVDVRSIPPDAPELPPGDPPETLELGGELEQPTLDGSTDE
jgi:recombination protein RecT